MSDGPADQPTAAERRLGELMGLLAAEQPAADPEFSHQVVRRARLQRAIATPLRTIGSFVAAVGDGVRALLGLTGEGRP
jgi:hypothetical protein